MTYGFFKNLFYKITHSEWLAEILSWALLLGIFVLLVYIFSKQPCVLQLK